MRELDALGTEATRALSNVNTSMNKELRCEFACELEKIGKDVLK